MTDNTHDTDAQLIDILRGLNPTEGVWEFDDAIFAKNGKDYECVASGYTLDDDNWRDDGLIEINNPDDAALITVAPAMRALILRQADELAALKSDNEWSAYKQGYKVGRASAEKRIAELEAQLAAVTAERDEEREYINNLEKSLGVKISTWDDEKPPAPRLAGDEA